MSINHEAFELICKDIDESMHYAKLYAYSLEAPTITTYERCVAYTAQYGAYMDALSYIDTDGTVFEEKENQHGADEQKLFEALRIMKRALQNMEVNNGTKNDGTKND